MQNLFSHRADVERQEQIDVDGSPRAVWTVVAWSIPCLYSPQQTPGDATATAQQVKEAHARGTLYAAANADIRPSDRVTIVSPAGGPRLRVDTTASVVMGWHSVIHREYGVVSI